MRFKVKKDQRSIKFFQRMGDVTGGSICRSEALNDISRYLKESGSWYSKNYLRCEGDVLLMCSLPKETILLRNL